MRGFMRSSSILARESIDNRVNRQASRVTCPETPPARQAQLVWWDTSVVRSSARGRRVRESNGPMARREGSSGSGHNAERQYMLSGRGEHHAPSQAACCAPNSQCPLQRIAPAAHPNPADTTAPTRSPLALSYLTRISHLWYGSGEFMLIATIITWYARLSPNTLGLNSARGEIGRDTLTMVSLQLHLSVMRRAAGRQQFLQLPAELR
jgi:hypothetical protein